MTACTAGHKWSKLWDILEEGWTFRGVEVCAVTSLKIRRRCDGAPFVDVARNKEVETPYDDNGREASGYSHISQFGTVGVAPTLYFCTLCTNFNVCFD
ncbi:hypothetical protein WN51_11771 [Melipona quadrifasciata]|uniref:Uncharacterized protein n=1 Tax=Melipona quadrifasciata TaxID=166423 RepID=A0A0M9A3M8_9HYME|nr:hypothetical protein WN51_11771 [Melipona quadrifasciata]